MESRGFYTDTYWYWIGVGASVGFVFLFNIMYLASLTFLNGEYLLHLIEIIDLSLKDG